MKTKIHSLQTDQGLTITNQQYLEAYCHRSFKSLFSDQITPQNPGNLTLPRCLEACINQTDNTGLNKIPTNNEVHHSVFSINPNKALDLDGFNAKFYQTFWNMLQLDIQRMMSDFFGHGTLDPRLNETILVLIPKKGFSDN